MTNGNLRIENGQQLSWLERAKKVSYGDIQSDGPTERGLKIHALLEEILGTRHALPEGRKTHIRESDAEDAVGLLLDALEGEVKILTELQRNITERLGEWNRDLHGAPEKPQGELTEEQADKMVTEDSVNTMGWKWLASTISRIRARVQTSLHRTKANELSAAGNANRFTSEGDAWKELKKAS